MLKRTSWRDLDSKFDEISDKLTKLHNKLNKANKSYGTQPSTAGRVKVESIEKK